MSVSSKLKKLCRRIALMNSTKKIKTVLSKDVSAMGIRG